MIICLNVCILGHGLSKIVINHVEEEISQISVGEFETVSLSF